MGIDLIAEGVLKRWEDMGRRYDPLNNNCQEFVNDLCYKLCGEGFLLVHSSKTVGEAIANTHKNIADMVSSMLPPGLSQCTWVLLQPSVGVMTLIGKVVDVLHS